MAGACLDTLCMTNEEIISHYLAKDEVRFHAFCYRYTSHTSHGLVMQMDTNSIIEDKQCLSQGDSDSRDRSDSSSESVTPQGGESKGSGTNFRAKATFVQNIVLAYQKSKQADLAAIDKDETAQDASSSIGDSEQLQGGASQEERDKLAANKRYFMFIDQLAAVDESVRNLVDAENIGSDDKLVMSGESNNGSSALVKLDLSLRLVEFDFKKAAQQRVERESDGAVGNRYLKVLNTIWVRFNFARLFFLRIWRAASGIGVAVARHSLAFAWISTAKNAIFDAKSPVHAHLGWLGFVVYAARLVLYTIPQLIKAAVNGGWSGFKKAFSLHREKIFNDVVWGIVGIVTSFIVANPLVAGIIVAGLYLFDVINVFIHANRAHKKLLRENAKKRQDYEHRLFHLLEEVESPSMIHAAEAEENGLADTPAQTRSVISLADLNRALSTIYKNGVDGDATVTVTLKGKQYRVSVECARDACTMLAEMIDLRAEEFESQQNVNMRKFVAFGLFGSMMIGLAGSLMFYGGAHAAGTLSVTSMAIASGALTAVSATGLGLIALGAILVISFCVYQIVKQVKLAKAKKKRRAASEARLSNIKNNLLVERKSNTPVQVVMPNAGGGNTLAVDVPSNIGSQSEQVGSRSPVLFRRRSSSNDGLASSPVSAIIDVGASASPLCGGQTPST